MPNTEEETVTLSLNLLNSEPFKIGFDASALEETILVEALCDSSINKMDYGTSVTNHDATNIFVLKDDCARILSSFKTFITLETESRYVPVKPSPVLSFKDFEPYLSDSSTRPFPPADIVSRFLS